MTDPFTNQHRCHGDLDTCRREAAELYAQIPIHWFEEPGAGRLSVVIGHGAVPNIERRKAEFTNAPVDILGSHEMMAMQATRCR